MTGKEGRMVEKPAEKPCYEGRQHMFVEIGKAEVRDDDSVTKRHTSAQWWFCTGRGKVIKHKF